MSVFARGFYVAPPEKFIFGYWLHQCLWGVKQNSQTKPVYVGVKQKSSDQPIVCLGGRVISAFKHTLENGFSLSVIVHNYAIHAWEGTDNSTFSILLMEKLAYKKGTRPFEHMGVFSFGAHLECLVLKNMWETSAFKRTLKCELLKHISEPSAFKRTLKY